jgi:hypothetical protein
MKLPSMKENNKTVFRYVFITICLFIITGVSSIIWYGNHFQSGSKRDNSTSLRESEISKEQKIKLRDRHEKSNRNQHPFEATPRPVVRLMEAGTITDEAARFLELSESERILTQEAIDKHFARMRKIIAPTVETSISDSSTCFFIPALQDRGKLQIEEFQNDLAAILREERTKKLMLALPVTNYFGGFGQFDSYIEVIPRSGFPSEKRLKGDWVKIRHLSPDSAKPMGGISASWEIGSGWFPGLFENQSN